MATNVNWFVIWVPSSSTEMRKRRDTASELKKNTKSFAEMGESEDILRQDSSSHLERETSVVSTTGRFSVKEDGDSKDIASLHIVSSDDNKQTQFSFSVTLDRVEDILIELQSNGIGNAEHCTIRFVKHSLN